MKTTQQIFELMASDLQISMHENNWNSIDYETLLKDNPKQIRAIEKTLFEEDSSELESPNLTIKNAWIPSREKDRSIRIRTYHNNAVTERQPVYLFFHGGAFIFGSPEQYNSQLINLVNKLNITVVNVDYRLSPEHPYPAAINDGIDVLNYLLDNCITLNIDKDKVIIGGSSAGATIATSICLHLPYNLSKRITHQYLLYPPLSDDLSTESMLQLANAPIQSKQSAVYMWENYTKNSRKKEKASPLNHTHFKGIPNTTIVYCELDPFKDEAINYAKKLQSQEIKTQLIEVKGAVHAFDFFDCQLTQNYFDLQISLFKEIIK